MNPRIASVDETKFSMGFDPQTGRRLVDLSPSERLAVEARFAPNGHAPPENSFGVFGDDPLPALANATRARVDDAWVTMPVPMAEITDKLFESTGNWPRSAGGTLFADDPAHGLCFFPKHSAMLGWLQAKIGRVDVHRGTGCATKEEIFAEVSRTAQRYAAVEAYPHFPPITGHYYAHQPVKPGNGESLEKFLSLFNPETELDRDLIKGAVLTAFWGGPGGARPVHAITSRHGRGSGKTKLAELLSRLVGGAFDLSLGEKIDNVKKRLLTAESLTKRAVIVDNIKSQRVSWAELEAMVTAPEVSGHQLYSGERTRPNTLAWLFTLNGPSMSKDLAQRTVFIELAKPVHDPNWQDNATRFVEEHKWDIIADVAACFAQPPVKLERCSRWGWWEREILARLPEPEELQALIAERQAAINADDEESATVEDEFAERLDHFGYDPAVDSIHVPNNVAVEWFSVATGSRLSPTAMTRTVRQANGEGSMKRLGINPSRTHGRGLLWHGTDTDVHYDLADRMQSARIVGGSDWGR